MTWSSQGSAATYPTVQPAMNTAAKYAGALVFRLDPSSGIVYVTGRWAYAAPVDANGVPVSGPPLICTDKLPAAFRPVALVGLFPTNPNGLTNPTTINTDGTVAVGLLNNDGTVSASSANPGSTKPAVLRAFYFTNVNPG